MSGREGHLYRVQVGRVGGWNGNQRATRAQYRRRSGRLMNLEVVEDDDLQIRIFPAIDRLGHISMSVEPALSIALGHNVLTVPLNFPQIC
jgi:hypothetical protein